MGTRREQINWGETIQQFTARVLGDASRWTEIVSINSLAPPYFTVPASASARVAGYGDTLLVPGQPSDSVEPTKTTSEDVFKRDVVLSTKRLQESNGDFATVSGRENLRQALTHRVSTDEGELIFHPVYGCRIHELKGARNDPAMNLLGRKFVERAVLAEPRVSRVIAATASVDGDAMRADVEAMTVTGHPVDVISEA